MITAFRDGFQSCYGARVLTDDFLPAVTEAVNSGLTHLEIGGGARFQSLYFYCNEDAFTMMDRVRAAAGPEANLQTLSRGINVVGLDSQPKEIIKLHAELFKKHGVTTIRNFDALNDVDNLLYSAKCIKDAGLKHEVCITVMELPPGNSGAHNETFYTAVLKKILDSGLSFDSVCYKDATGTLTPATVFSSLKAARNLLGDKVRLAFHNHETAGIGTLSYRAALDAGVDQIDLSLAPVSGGTCQTDVVVMWHALRGTDYDLGLDIQKIMKLEENFKESMKGYFLPPEATRVEPLIPFSPMPGGALTANTQMLRDNGLMDRYPEVIAAMEEVVAKGGYGTSVTPVSQFYFQQAFSNVMHGPWKKISDGYGRMVLGYFGKTPVPPDPAVVKLASEQLKLPQTSESALELTEKDPEKSLDKARLMLKNAFLPETQENLFIAATCLEKGISFLKGEAKVNVRKRMKSDGHYSVTSGGKSFKVLVKENSVIVDGEEIQVSQEGSMSAPQVSSHHPAVQSGDGEGTGITAPLPGLVIRFLKKPGEKINKGDMVLVLESMKEEHTIPSGSSGTLKSWLVAQGDQVSAGHKLAELGE